MTALDMHARLVRIGFQPCQADAALAALGPTASLDELGNWISRMQLVQTLVAGGWDFIVEGKEDDSAENV